MDAVTSILKQIGQQLNEDISPLIMNGGIVTPNDSAVPTKLWAEENENERQRTRGSATKSRQWPSRGQGKTDRTRTTLSTTPSVSSNLHAKYENKLIEVEAAYPDTKVWRQAEGLWLLSQSNLLPGLRRKAIFITGIPFDPKRSVRGWGFWWTPQLPTEYVWIGPRHTNWPDGSICAFEPSDGTWMLGDSLSVLLDLYTLWALRHLYLELFGSWPGRQVAHYVHERLLEIKPDEFCGCGSNKAYSNCCKTEDLINCKGIIPIVVSRRSPPDTIISFIRTTDRPPDINSLLPLQIR